MKLLLIVGSFLTAILIITSCQNQQQVDYNRYYSAGAAVYQSHCQNCHGANGEGLGGLIPPLTDMAFLKTNRHKLACYLESGLKGAITVNNKKFEGQMPATSLSPIEIAQVLTYVTNSFGNKAGLINNDEVQKDLKGCSPTQTLP